jgi:tetratricopeptide (TPR) repeat protein
MPTKRNDKSMPILIAIAKDFLYKDKGSYDAEYAEKIFKGIERLAGKEAFDEELRYLRAYNLEKSKEYIPAEEQYRILTEAFPQTKRYDEVIYKAGIITTYIARDIEKGRLYFEKLSQKSDVSAQVISSLYHLGLIYQWQKDSVKAKEYYLKLTERAGSDFVETQELAKQRLKEIENSQEIEYNLRMFLEATFSSDPRYDMGRLELKASPFRVENEQSTQIQALAYMPESGCMSVEVNYLWSGHLGTATPSTTRQEFPASYKHRGTKETNLVVVTSSGALDRSLIMVDAE